MSHNEQFTMQDPASQYMMPSFRKQKQSKPGVAQNLTLSRLTAHSYDRTGLQVGRKALVTVSDTSTKLEVEITFAGEDAYVVMSCQANEDSDAKEIAKQSE